MDTITLSVAGYCFSLVPAEKNVAIRLPQRYTLFHAKRAIPGVTITVHRGTGPDISHLKEVFHAPYVRELNGVMMKVADRLWTIRHNNGDIFVQSTLPEDSAARSATLGICPGKGNWDIWVDTEEESVNPLSYPLDSLLLYYLTAINKDIFLHSSAVTFQGKGLVFCGVSGRGKSTMARLWHEKGARVIHDDRTIISRSGEFFRVWNTPVYDNETPSSANLSAIFLIEHGVADKAVKLSGKEAITGILSNSIQHGWNREIIYDLLMSIESLVKKIPVYSLQFVPEATVTDYITHILDHGVKK